MPIVPAASRLGTKNYVEIIASTVGLAVMAKELQKNSKNCTTE
jgi:hypothetical protein